MNLKQILSARLRAGGTVLTLCLASPSLLLAQTSQDEASDILATRQVLEARLAEYEAAASSRAYSAELRAGFHMFPPEAPLTEAIMSVGGPGAEADMGEMRISRGIEIFWEDAQLRDAIRAGLTLDELDLHAGDEIYVPARPFSLAAITASVTVVTTLLFTLTRIF